MSERLIVALRTTCSLLLRRRVDVHHDLHILAALRVQRHLRPATRGSRGRRYSTPRARSSTSGPSSPYVPHAQRIRQLRQWQLFVKLKHEQDHHHELDRCDHRGPTQHLEALWMSRKRIDEQLVQVLHALLPHWVKRCGVLKPCSLLRRHRGHVLDDGTAQSSGKWRPVGY